MNELILEKLEKLTEGGFGKLDKSYSLEQFNNLLGTSITEEEYNSERSSNEYGTQDLQICINDEIVIMVEINNQDRITHIDNFEEI